MNKERELENLGIMRDNGLISEASYQAQRSVLLGKPLSHMQLEKKQKRLQPLSLLQAFKFSFRPAVFGANFVFLFAMVMFFLIAFIILFSCLEVFSNPFALIERSDFFQNVGFIFGIVFAIVIVFWEAIWIAFFSRLSLECLERDFPPFEWKPFIKKSLALTGLFLLFLLMLLGLFVGFERSVQWVQQQTFVPWKQYTFSISLLVMFISIAFCMVYVQIAAMTACIGSAKYWVQTVGRALKSPLLVLFAFACFVLNGLVVFLGQKGMEYSAEPLSEIIVRILDIIMDISGLNAFGIFGVYLALGIISFLLLIFLPQRGKFWFKMSFLFVIPSLIILISVFSVLPVRLSLPSSFYFAYFLIMHLFWALMYLVMFWVSQSMAFMAHILTQVWCHLTHDKAGNYLFASEEEQPLVVVPQPQEEEEYLPPEVFR